MFLKRKWTNWKIYRESDKLIKSNVIPQFAKNRVFGRGLIFYGINSKPVINRHHGIKKGVRFSI